MKKLLYVFLIFSLSCQSDEGINGSAILTIDVQEASIPNGMRAFYSLKGESGINIESGELHTGRLFISKDSYQGEKMAVTFFYAWPYVQNSASTYLDVPVGQTITFERRNTSQNNTISSTVKFENFPEDFDKIALGQYLNTKRLRPQSIMDGRSVSFDFNTNDPLTLSTFIPFEGRWEYQILDVAPEIKINRNNNQLMENEHIISIPNAVNQNFRYSFSLRGFVGDASPQNNNYYLNDEFVALFTSNNLKFYTPNIFSDFYFSLGIHSENSSYEQSTIGEIPSEYKFLDATFDIDSIFINQGSRVNSTEDLTYLTYSWRSDDDDDSERFVWEIYSPPVVIGNYSLQQIPEVIVKEIDQLEDLERLKLHTAKAVKADNMNYPKWLLKRWDSNRDLDSVVMSKTVGF